jgi:DNA mismatch repair protein MSH6
MVSSKTPSASGKGKNLKQGTLFSFFSKKPGSADPKSTKSVARTTTSDITPAAAKTSSVTPPSSSAASSQPSSSPTCEIQQPWQQVEVGMRIAVYWKDDRQYYNAKVTARKSSRKSEVTLRYDDGEVECLDLATETFRILKDDEEPAKKKRRVGPHDESDEELEFEDDIEDKDDDEAYEDRSESEDEEDVEEAKQWVKDDEDEDVFIDTDEEEEKKPKKRTTNNKVKVTHVTPSTSTKTPAPRKLDSKFSSLTPTPSSKQTPRPSLSESLHSAASSETGAPMPYVDGQCNSAGSHVHNHLKFLRNPTDSKGLSPTDPDYDPHTLKVDWEELKRHITVSQAVEQWWNIKSQYFDTVLLFKTGKFYEMFHMDADIGVNLLEFQYMKGLFLRIVLRCLLLSVLSHLASASSSSRQDCSRWLS